MHVQTTDPTDDRGAFIGCALGCALLCGSLLLADTMTGPGHEALALTSASRPSLSGFIGVFRPRSTLLQNR